jgi:SpoVK/Ycf46/Vps4 family AAA+-type ATPase
MDHLFDELRRIDMLIQSRVLKMKMNAGGAQNEFSGLYITEAEIDTILSEEPAFESQPDKDAPQIRSLLDSLADLEERISQRKAVSCSGDIDLRLMRLQDLFRLSSFELDVLLIALVSEFDLRYERLFAYMQDDITKKRPSVDLILNLLCSSLDARLAARRYFSEERPLLRYHLLLLSDDGAHPNPSLLGKNLKTDERVVNYLTGSGEIDTRLSAYTRIAAPRIKLKDLLLPSTIKKNLGRLIHATEMSERALIFHFQGPYGVGKQSTAEALCHESRCRLLRVDGRHLLSQDGLNFETSVQLIDREALLQGAAIYWKGFDGLIADDKRPLLDLLIKILEKRPGPNFLAGEKAWEPANTLHETSFVRIEIPRPAFAERIDMWRRVLNDGTPHDDDVNLEVLANKFRLTGGQIRDATATSRNLARWRDPNTSLLTMADLHTACRLQSNRKLAELAQKINPLYTWDDIVLPPDRSRQMREICNYVKYRSVVYDKWGFDRKLSLGKGLNVLFAGPSGTGKTMAAEIIAGDLSLDLYKIDLSTVVSKYIGETEKNLSRIFTEAETSNAILFFDEADSLFGKRSEVRDSHDRYANIEISYLLQRMEQYVGVVILATNLQKNMDEAFVRRMHFTVEFPFPNPDDRRRIWQGIWPDETPRAPGLDLEFMAHRFEITGGNIRNIALAASFLAAADGGVVSMPHLIGATQREFQKMGKLIMKEEFGEYAASLNVRT